MTLYSRLTCEGEGSSRSVATVVGPTGGGLVKLGSVGSGGRFTMTRRGPETSRSRSAELSRFEFDLTGVVLLFASFRSAGDTICTDAEGGVVTDSLMGVLDVVATELSVRPILVPAPSRTELPGDFSEDLVVEFPGEVLVVGLVEKLRML